MSIVASTEQKHNIFRLMRENPHVLSRVYLSPKKHPAINTPLATTVTFCHSENDKSYTFCHAGNDNAFLVDDDDLLAQTSFLTYTTDPSVLDYCGFVIDLNTLYYANTGLDLKQDINQHLSQYTRNIHRLIDHNKNINIILPSTVWSATLRRMNHALLETGLLAEPNPLAAPTYMFLRAASRVLRTIENAGVAVDPALFVDAFGERSVAQIHDGKVYSNYNIRTKTGRPSNSFGGVNYAALNKSDGSRAPFVSRFDGGKLVQFDFEAYHLRLLGKYANIPLPPTSVHEYLAQQYYNTSSVTKEQYDSAKSTTFRILYGEEVETHIPELIAIQNIADDIYNNYNLNGELTAPVSKRKISVPEGAHKNKVFSYFMQALEFETTIPMLDHLLSSLLDREAVAVLYTYDSILIDCPPNELEWLIKNASTLMNISDQNPYPIRVSVGLNYDNLTNV